MKFILETLVDITNTGSRRGDKDQHRLDQEQNYQTIIQTLGLRTNITVLKQPESLMSNAHEFGSKFKGKQKFWKMTFIIEAEDALDINNLIEDFDLVPIILGLDERVEMEHCVFRTVDENNKNITFKCVDD